MELSAVTDARSVAHSPGVHRLPNLKALTSVRFFAALHVAVYHLVRPFSVWGPLAPFFASGYVAVSFFFVLSGFILTYSHAFEYERGKGDPRKFYVARFARIYPVYLLTTIAAGLIMRVEFTKLLHVFAFIADVLVLQSWSIRVANFFNIPAWSISTEAFFYLVFPFVLILLRPSSRKNSLLAVAGFWLLALAVPLFSLVRYPGLSWTEFGPPGGAPGANTVFWIRRFPGLALPEFLAGVSLGWFYLRFRPGPRTAAAMAWVGGIGTVAALLLSDHLPFLLLHNGLLIPLFAMSIIGLSYPNALTRLLSVDWLVVLGEASFSLYLIHFLFNNWWASNFSPELTLSKAAVKLAIVVPLSVLLHLCVERPCRRMILGWWSKRHPRELVLSPANPHERQA